MTDDIVTRLRDLCITGDNMWEVDVCVAMDEAADEIERLRNKLAEQELVHAVQKTNTVNEIVRLRAELEIAAQIKQFVCLWWDDPLLTAEICEAWDNLPEEVRMWVLDD